MSAHEFSVIRYSEYGKCVGIVYAAQKASGKGSVANWILNKLDVHK